MTVSVGRMNTARSARLSCMRWCRRCRTPPKMPYQFFMPKVAPVRLWCLATGTLITLSASRNGSSTGHTFSTSPPRLASLNLRSSGSTTRAPAWRAAASMPLRAKQRRGSFTETSVTTTRFAPASTHIRTSSATMSGLVLAPCSGVRSQPTFGLMSTTSPRETNRPMPPSSSTARRASDPGISPCTTDMSARSDSRGTR